MKRLCHNKSFSLEGFTLLLQQQSDAAATLEFVFSHSFFPRAKVKDLKSGCEGFREEQRRLWQKTPLT